MIQVKDNHLWRGGIKIGHIEDNHIFDHEDKKIGYFVESEKKIFNSEGKNIGHILGDFIVVPGSNSKIRIEDNLEEVNGGTLSDLCRAAIRILLG
jgi:hypothetical protein